MEEKELNLETIKDVEKIVVRKSDGAMKFLKLNDVKPFRMSDGDRWFFTGSIPDAYSAVIGFLFTCLQLKFAAVGEKAGYLELVRHDKLAEYYRSKTGQQKGG